MPSDTASPVNPAPGPAGRPRVVIAGAGFGGLSAARALAHADAEVILVDKRNHHVFQPLLYQVATAGLAPTQIASPIRAVLSNQANARVLLGNVQGVDTAARELVLDHGRQPYDYLVLATGATHAYFGKDEWRKVAPGLKSLEDALAIRRRVLLAFERAELAETDAERDRLLTFVIIGGGPTGVELAGAIAELARRALVRDFRKIRMSMARVILVEGGERVLAALPPVCSTYARNALGKLGVEVREGRPVSACDDDGVEVGGERISSATLIWAAGVQASPVARWLGLPPSDRAARVQVGPDLSAPSLPNVFVIGDAASALRADGRPIPGVAPAAKQQGAYVGHLIAARIKRPGAQSAPFRYRDYGSLATIGRKRATISFRSAHLSGHLAWFLWSLAHVYFLIGFRNRVAVTLDWVWSYFTFEQGARLITGDLMGEM